VGGVRWHVQVAGRGPAVLLVHGAAGGTHSWHRVLPRLAERYTVIAPDLPGHAFTSRPADPFGMTLPGMARSVAALLGELGVAPRMVVGHSAGAAVLVRMALDGALGRTRLLVGLNAALLPPSDPSVALGRSFGGLFASAQTAQWASLLARHTNATARLLEGTGSRVPAEIARCYEALTTAPDHVQGAFTMLSGWDVAALGREFHRVTLPTLLLAARDDRWVPARTSAQVAREIPGARFELVEGHGHLMHEEADDQTAERLLEAADDADRREHATSG
jgi:magnesium chelatase accessory protein